MNININPQEMEICITRNISEYIQFTNDNYEAGLYTEVIGADKSLTIPVPVNDYELITNAKAYMTGPVCMYDKKTHAAEIVRKNSLKELKEYLTGKEYILYYAYASIRTQKANSDVSELKSLERPEVNFLFRGVILN